MSDPWAEFRVAAPAPAAEQAADPWAAFRIPEAAPAASELSGDEIRAANAGDTRAKMSPKDIEYAYDTAAARGDAPERRAMSEAYVARERADSPITTGIGDRFRAAARGVPFVGEYLDEANAKTSALLGGDYQKRLDYERARDRSFDAQNPIQSGAGRVGGAIAGTIAAAPLAAATKTSALLGLGAKAIPGAVGRGALAGAAQGAAAGYGGADEGENARAAALKSAGIGAGFGAIIPGALGAGKAAIDSAAGRTITALTPTIEKLRAAADDAYEGARRLGVQFRPGAVSRLAENISATLQAKGYRDYNADKVFRAVNELRSAADDATQKFTAPSQGKMGWDAYVATQPQRKAIEVADIEGVRRLFNTAAADPTQKEAARTARNLIDDFLERIKPSDVIAGDAEKAAELLRAGRSNYSAVKRAELLEEATDKALRRAARSGKGGNEDNATRQIVDNILNSRSKSAGFSKDEINAMRRLVMGTKAGNAARFVGQFAPTGIVSTAGSSGAGYGLATLLGLPAAAGAAIPAAGYASKKIGDAVTGRQLTDLIQRTMRRSALGEKTRHIAEQVTLGNARTAEALGHLGGVSGGVAPQLVPTSR